MGPADLALIAAMRTYAIDPSGICFSIDGSRGSVAIFRDEIESRADQALIAFLLDRGVAPGPDGWVYRSVHLVG